LDTKISISVEFLESLIDLPKNIQEKTIDFFSKFYRDISASGINLEQINIVNGKQLYSVRIDLNYRGILYKEDQTNVFHLLWVEHHNEVYNNVDLKKDIKISNISVNSKNYYDKLGISKNKSNTLFSSISKKELLSLGLEERLLPLIRNLRNIEALQTVKELLPNDVYTNLELVAYKIHVKEVISENNYNRKLLIGILKDDVLIPALNKTDLPQEIKSSIQNTIDRIESKRSIMAVIEFYYDALMSNRGKYIHEKLKEKKLLAFEDIEPKIRDFINKI